MVELLLLLFVETACKFLISFLIFEVGVVVWMHLFSIQFSNYLRGAMVPGSRNNILNKISVSSVHMALVTLTSISQSHTQVVRCMTVAS